MPRDTGHVPPPLQPLSLLHWSRNKCHLKGGSHTHTVFSHLSCYAHSFRFQITSFLFIRLKSCLTPISPWVADRKSVRRVTRIPRSWHFKPLSYKNALQKNSFIHPIWNDLSKCTIMFYSDAHHRYQTVLQIYNDNDFPACFWIWINMELEGIY